MEQEAVPTKLLSDSKRYKWARKIAYAVYFRLLTTKPSILDNKEKVRLQFMNRLFDGFELPKPDKEDINETRVSIQNEMISILKRREGAEYVMRLEMDAVDSISNEGSSHDAILYRLHSEEKLKVTGSDRL